MKNIFLIVSLLATFSFAELIRNDSKEVVVDTKTNLMWTDSTKISSVDNRKSQQDAIVYCNNLTHGGYSDWRLPEIGELVSIRVEKKYNPQMSKVFQSASTQPCWSKNPGSSESSGLVAGFNRKKPITEFLKFFPSMIRCVRNNK